MYSVSTPCFHFTFLYYFINTGQHYFNQTQVYLVLSLTHIGHKTSHKNPLKVESRTLTILNYNRIRGHVRWYASSKLRERRCNAVRKQTITRRISWIDQTATICIASILPSLVSGCNLLNYHLI